MKGLVGLPAALAGVLVLVLGAGCSSVDTRTLAAKEDLKSVRESLKDQGSGLKVYVAPVEVRCREDAFDPNHSDRYGLVVDREHLMEEVGESLGAMFASVKVHEDLKETAREARLAAFQGGYDLILVPRLVKYDAVFVKTNGWWWPNALFVAWYFYFPSWWIADEVYGVQATIEYDVESARNDRPITGLRGRSVAVDSRQADFPEGREVPRGPRLDLDDLDRGLDWGTTTYAPGTLDRDQWAKRVDFVIEPYARRSVAIALAKDLGLHFAKFHRLEPEQQAQATAAIHAVVVGVGQYSPDDPCPYADKDAQAIGAWLTGEAVGPDVAPIGTGAAAAHTPSKLVHVLTNGRATRAAVEAELTRTLADARPEDTVLFYFAGRGVRGTEPGTKGLGLACYGASKQERADGAEVLSLARLDEILASRKLAKRLVLLDTSFSGKGLRAIEGVAAALDLEVHRKDLATFLGRSGETGSGCVVVANRPDGPAHVFDAARHGLLTYALVDGLLGAADVDGQGKTYGALAQHLERTVGSVSELDLGAAQRPVVLFAPDARSLVLPEPEDDRQSQ